MAERPAKRIRRRNSPLISGGMTSVTHPETAEDAHSSRGNEYLDLDPSLHISIPDQPPSPPPHFLVPIKPNVQGNYEK